MQDLSLAQETETKTNQCNSSNIHWYLCSKIWLQHNRYIKALCWLVVSIKICKIKVFKVEVTVCIQPIEPLRKSTLRLKLWTESLISISIKMKRHKRTIRSGESKGQLHQRPPRKAHLSMRAIWIRLIIRTWTQYMILQRTQGSSRTTLQWLPWIEIMKTFSLAWKATLLRTLPTYLYWPAELWWLTMPLLTTARYCQTWQTLGAPNSTWCFQMFSFRSRRSCPQET